MKLRDYQISAVNQVYDQFRSGKNRVLLVLPCGAGKTSTFSYIIQQFRQKRPDQKVIALAHRVELIEQMHNSLDRMGVYSWASFFAAPNRSNYRCCQ